MYRLKKSLGQHFLHDENVCKRIVEAVPAMRGSNLLEVGPGGGALTKYLAQLPDINYKAIEIDAEKVRGLHLEYPAFKENIVEGDILRIAPPFEGEFNIIGNFPYNISSQILFRVLEWRAQVPAMVGMFQKEVAQRIASGPGNKTYGILSVLVQAFYRVEYLFEVGEQCFTPPPKVRSAVIRLQYLGNPYGITREKRFFMLVKAAFNQRRKMLRNPLKPYFPPDLLQSPLFTKRAEELSVQEFVDLSNYKL